MDVDGVLTTGGISWLAPASSAGPPLELKTFNVKDGLGLSLVLAAGLEVAWITGRQSVIVTQRASELRVPHVLQWARDKQSSLEELAARLGHDREEILYIGDDLNDLPAFAAAGVRVAVADAAEAVRERADWVTRAPGGHGAVREVIDTLLDAQGQTEEALHRFLLRLREEQRAGPAAAAAAQ
jgi:3-deoxy-D-manno-octulosonate 8-phosphate phosphatase (KDO 8-P phosphatase)